VSGSRYATGGFEARFRIERADGRPCDPRARYMVLNLGLDDSGQPLDPFAHELAGEYAARVRAVNSQLADDLAAGLRDGFPAAVAQHKDAK
jgi:hypothetical protein